MIRIGILLTLIGLCISGWAGRRMIYSLSGWSLALQTTIEQVLRPGAPVPVFEGWDGHVTRSRRELAVGLAVMLLGLAVQLFAEI
ncbi:MAG: hypothetical protein WA005_19705 [Candidatus Binataceae bacterium]